MKSSNSYRHSLRRSPLTPSTSTLLNRNGSSPIDFASAGVPTGLLHSLPHSNASVYRSLREKSSKSSSSPSSSSSRAKHPETGEGETSDKKPVSSGDISSSATAHTNGNSSAAAASPTLSSASTTKNVYSTIVRQLDSSPSAVRRSVRHAHHSPKFPITNHQQHLLTKPVNRSTNIDHIRYNHPHHHHSSSYSTPQPTPINDTTFDSESLTNTTVNISSHNNSPNITKNARFLGSACDSTDYSTLQYSPAQSRDRQNISFDSNTQVAQFKPNSPAGQLKRSKMNSKRYSMDVQDFIHRPSGSSTSDSSSAMETLSSIGANSGNGASGSNNNNVNNNNNNNNTTNSRRASSNGNGYGAHDSTSDDRNSRRRSNSSQRTGDSPEGYFTIEQEPYVTLDNSVNKPGGSNSSTSSRQCDKYGFFIDENANIERSEPKKTTTSEMKCVREREAKWLQMLNNWKYYINFKWDKIRDRCRKGIPHSLRSQAWFYLCGAHLQKRRHPRKFQELLTQKLPDDIRNDIEKDLHRQFPSHEMFAERGGTGQTDLFNVLKAFAVYKPKIGYCQAQGPIAAVLLMHMPAEHAFWSLVSLNDYYIGGYFRHNLEEIQIQGQMLFAFLKKLSPSAYNLLKRQNIDPILYMTEWFMCIYSRTLTWSSVLRVWDMFLCEGISVLFKVGLYLVDVSLRGENTKSCPSMYETCQKLRHIPESYLKEENLVKALKNISLKDADVMREHKIQAKKFRKQKTPEVR